MDSSRRSFGLLTPVLALVLAASLILPLQAPARAQQASAPAQSSGWEVFDDWGAGAYYSLDMLNAAAGWAGGAGGDLRRFNGTEWVPGILDTRDAVMGISMVATNDVWAVTSGGDIYHYDGFQWQLNHTVTDIAIDDVFFLNSGLGWACGNNGSVSTYTGTWVAGQHTGAWLDSIEVLPDLSDGWIVGAGVILRWGIHGWGLYETLVGVWLHDVDIVAPNDVWAVGSGGSIYHFDGVSWTAVDSPTTETLQGISMLSADNGWAVGFSGTILHYDGVSWKQVTSPTINSLYAVQMLAEDDGWAVGRWGTVLRYTGVAEVTDFDKTVSSRRALPGDVLEYTIEFANTGTLPAQSVAVTDTIPVHTTYVAAIATATKGTVTGPDPLVLTVDELAAGETVTLTFQVQIEAGASDVCWFVPNEAVLGWAGAQQTQGAMTTVGDGCYGIYLPLIQR